MNPVQRVKTVLSFAGPESYKPVNSKKKTRSPKSGSDQDRFMGKQPEAEPVVKATNKRNVQVSSEGVWDIARIMQKFPSRLTSINAAKMPAAIKNVVADNVKPGDVIADIGGGKFDNVKAWAVAQGAACYIIDPYNRTREENLKGIKAVRNGKADISMANNVLNVIKEPENRERVVKQVWDALKPEEGTGVISIYEGDQTGKGRITRKLDGRGESWQEQRKAETYFDEISKVVGKDNLILKGNTFILKKPKAGKNRPPEPTIGSIDLLV